MHLQNLSQARQWIVNRVLERIVRSIETKPLWVRSLQVSRLQTLINQTIRSDSCSPWKLTIESARSWGLNMEHMPVRRGGSKLSRSFSLFKARSLNSNRVTHWVDDKSLARLSNFRKLASTISSDFRKITRQTQTDLIGQVSIASLIWTQLPS